METVNTVAFAKEMTPVLDVDMEQIETWAKEDGIPVEREIVQWLTRNFVHTMSSDEAKKIKLHKLALKHQSSFKIEVTLNGNIKWGEH